MYVVYVPMSVCVRVYEYVYACVHVCVDAQSQHWMSHSVALLY